MSAKIVLANKYATGNLVYIDTNLNKLPKTLFSKTERKFINEELKNDRKMIVINQFKRYVFIQILEDKKGYIHQSEAMRKAGDSIAAQLNKQKQNTVTIMAGNRSGAALAMAEGMALGNYQFIQFRKDKAKEKNALTTINVVCENVTPKDISMLNITVDAVCHARDLVNMPNSHQTATQLAASFQDLGKKAGFEVEVWNMAKISSMKMGGLLAVNVGSPEPPTFTVMEYKPANAVNKKPYVLVGKGVVYDTGGLSLKPTANSMDLMKCDMAGSAVVACTMYAIAKAKLPVHVIGLTPATDNRPGGNAFAPGDIIHMMNGATVEMLNSDAEGRMILADALHHAKQYKPELVCEFSTLTGAAAAAIGHYGIVCMGTANDEVKDKLKLAGNNVFERLVEFPFWEEYDDLLKSDIADFKNIGGPYGGAITAGRFLNKFTDYPYMHFDIAGPAFHRTRDSYRNKDATGVGVRLMMDFFRAIAQ
ncbi:MAG: leucyl aminopeptidase family protein [Bacteroidetes bacterium]|nr:leucyl aminopeptidase family protein [Bacteroidota bacterium]